MVLCVEAPVGGRGGDFPVKLEGSGSFRPGQP